MTGRIHYPPEAERQLDDLDEWITKKASVDTARRLIRWLSRPAGPWSMSSASSTAAKTGNLRCGPTRPDTAERAALPLALLIAEY